MYAEIASAIQSARALSELLKAAKSLSNYNELVAAVSEVNSKLMDATTVALSSQEKQSQLASQVRELQEALEKVERWTHQIGRYELIEFQATGGLAYALRSESADGQPMHYACTACVDKRQFSLLQPMNGRRFLHCLSCKATVEIDLPPKPELIRYHPGGGGWMGR